MSAALISGLLTGLAGVIAQNGWYYWKRRSLQILAYALVIAGALLIGWGADMAHRSIAVVLVLAMIVIAVAGSLAFVAFMAEVRHQGWVAVVKQMRPRGRQQ